MQVDERVINICFHGIGEPGRELESGEDRYWVPMASYLRTLDEIASWPSVTISFDDGNASDLELGLAPLVERGLTATFFVLAGRLGTGGSLDVDGLRELRRRGMTIGSHGMHHRPWPSLDDDARRVELVDARTVIGEAIDAPVDQVALPLGRYDRSVLSDLRRLGYHRVHSSDRRHARRGSWLQPRFSVRADDTAASLRASVLSQPTLPRRLVDDARGLVKRLR